MTDLVQLLLVPPSKKSSTVTPKSKSKVSPLRFSYKYHTISKARQSSPNPQPRKIKPKVLPPLAYDSFLNSSIQIKYDELRALFKKS